MKYLWKSVERQQRIRQVLAELTDETAKQDLDANALAARKLNLDVLDEKQKAKLQALGEATKLLPVFAGQ
ncbi:MAG: hypothetical protein HY858_15015 [Candidatus Solibacter usitatus]|nr:hypothetical protein [Candidatus Solibacter usitatus]